MFENVQTNVEINTKRETVLIRMIENVQTMLVWSPDVFNFVVGTEWVRGDTGPIFLILQSLTFCLTYYQPYETMTGPKSSELLT